MGDGSVHPVRRSKAHPFRPCRIRSALSAPCARGRLRTPKRGTRPCRAADSCGHRCYQRRPAHARNEGGAVRARCAQAGARGRGEAGAGTEAAASPEACRPLPAASGPPARRAEPDRTPFRRRPSSLAIWLASWALSVESKKPVTDVRDGLQVTLVAGTRNPLYRTTLLWHLRPRVEP